MPFAENPLESFQGAFDSFPLRIGVSSFVWPAGYAENVKRLKGVFGEVQLLAYETLDRSPVTEEELHELASLKDGDFSYSLHLPAPGNLANPDVAGAEDAIAKAIATFKPIGVSSNVLHIERNGHFDMPLAAARLERILKRTNLPPEQLCVENLIGTPFDAVWEAVEHLGVSVCFDIGHWMYEQADPLKFIDRYGHRIRMCHIHGVADRDHRPLSAMPEETLASVLTAVADCRPAGAVVIENFSVGDVVESVRCLAHGARRFFKVGA